MANPSEPSIAVPRTKIKCRLETAGGEWVERIPAWIKWATQEWNEVQYNGVYYDPPNGQGAPGELDPEKHYTFKYPRPPRPRALRIYECHVGMSSQVRAVQLSATRWFSVMQQEGRQKGGRSIRQ